jgi:hypothetical protein
MTRKDYIAIADVIRKQLLAQTCFETSAEKRIHYLALDLCGVFAKDNPNFDEQRFMQATGTK